MLIPLIDIRMLDDVHLRALERLVDCVEEELLDHMVTECMRSLSIDRVDTPQQLLLLGESLTKRGRASERYGGTIAMMGRLMRTRAILLGAKV